MKRLTISPAAVVVACVVIAACGGSGSSGPATTAPPAPGPAISIVLPLGVMTSGTTMQASAMIGSSAATNVTWSSSDILVALVNPAGLITARRAGVATLTATSGNSKGTTTVQVNSGPPAELSYYLGEGQSGPAGNYLPDPLCTRVVDASGNVVIGAKVTYTVTSGGGLITQPVSPETDVRGVATSGLFSLGLIKGEQTVTATSGSAPPLVFHATAQ